MRRRDFLIGAGAAALGTVTGAPLLSGCGHGSPVEKLPFNTGPESLESIRNKIAHNGYRFTVERNLQYNFYGDPSRPRVPFPQGFLSLEADSPVASTDLTLGSEGDLPPRFDLRNDRGHSYLGPIRDQLHTCQCWAFSAVDAASGAHNWRNGLADRDAVSLSSMYLKFALGSLPEYGWKGGNPNTLPGLLALTRYGIPGTPVTGYEGACLEADFPFEEYEDCQIAAQLPPDWLGQNALRFPRIAGRRAGLVAPSDWRDTTRHIKAAIYRYGPVTASVDSCGAFAGYASGIYEDTNTLPQNTPYFVGGGHALSLVGWDDYPPEGGGGCWIVRNEWGTGWGEAGYMRIRYFSAQVNFHCGFIEGSAPDDGVRMIYGTVSGNFAFTTVSLTGADSYAMVVDDSGRYYLPGISPGRYRVVPTKPGRSFDPPSAVVDVGDSDVKLNFTAS